MAGSQRAYRQKIRATQALKKIFRAMELIAASRIGKARDRVSAATPYSDAITEAISEAAAVGNVETIFTKKRQDTDKVALLVITADRGMAGAYSANAIRESERLRARLLESGHEVVQFAAGRRAVSYFKFRRREMAGEWVGASDAPTHAVAEEIAAAMLGRLYADAAEGGVAELHIVYTHFKSMVAQEARVIRLLPLEIIHDQHDGEEGESSASSLYEFEPSAEAVLDTVLPRYVEARIYSCLLQSAASELASRQRAMNTATTNAEDIIRNYTRLANQARQAEITQEISEIVSGADALAAAS